MFFRKNPVITPRRYWMESLTKIAKPVLEAAAADRLKERLPFQGKGNTQKYMYLEALGRTICGLAPWLECQDGLSPEEEKQRKYFVELSRKSIANAVNPKAKDYMVFEEKEKRQPLVDAAFLAQGILRAPHELWEKLDREAKENVIREFKRVRRIIPWRNNWILFSAMIETFLEEFDGTGNLTVIDYGLSQFEQWYVGDGCYKDGFNYRFDYYNGIVIHPMLWDIAKRASWYKKDPILKRMQRHAAICERLIAPDGSYPIVGRSIAYRMGIFHGLALCAYDKCLGESPTYAQVRCSLTAVLKKVMTTDIFTAEGWLRIGVAGDQPLLGEEYINTGSLYLCTTMFLPLGLSPQDPFWSDPDEDWTSKKVWGGNSDVKIDKAL